MSNENISTQILSDLAVYSKYAKYLPELKRRETWEECVFRNAQMHVKKFPKLEAEIWANYSLVLDKKILPSMRALQFAGTPIELNNTRLYNCSALPIDSYEAFHEVMFLLLSGCGVGYSVQKHHVAKLPTLIGPSKSKRKYQIGDSIIGWSDAVKMLMKSYFFNKPLPDFDYRDIRPKGSLLVTSGGFAPGPAPLKDGLHNIQKVLDKAIEERGSGTKLTTLEAHDICCYIADCVLSGGIRRAACVALFSLDDTDMLECKFGNWWETNPQRARANNSVVMLRHKATKQSFDSLWEKVEASGSGEPGILFSHDKNMLFNPCLEASLEPHQFCNLTTVNVSNIESQEDLNERVRAAAFIGTLQASYTDFHYLRPIWKETTEKDALLGISMTGIASGEIDKYDTEQAAKEAIEVNKEVANLIGINPARRLTLIKPEGTSSLVLGTSSGIHAWHSPYYIRRMRFNKNEAIYKYLSEEIPEIVEDDFFKPEKDGVVSIPVKAPEGSICRKDETAIDLLNRMKYLFKKWVLPGHLGGDNTNNISITVSIKPDEWKEVGEWMWENRNNYNGIAVLPYDLGTYKQPPYEEITKEEYEKMSKVLHEIDLTKVIEEVNTVNHMEVLACSGSGCEVR